ncbi:MAG TPA: carbonate dehydratase [Gammaproteobacteria bacterium]|nr:carbonate dehydratase [Gammaproteobacteria bacterium]
MDKLPQLFANNRAWAEGISRKQPDFFKRLAAQQSPKYLWIGCADSRVPANEIVGLMPGEVFVHRNVANVVVHSDLNCLSVLQYAVEVLKVEHVIVCGHYGCGGVQAAWRGASLGLIDNWLRHVKDVAEKYSDDLAARPDDETRMDRLCELNVIEQVLHVARTTIVQDAWKRGQPLILHGWVYRLQSGLLKDIGICISSEKELKEFIEQRVMPGGLF